MVNIATQTSDHNFFKLRHCRWK